MARVRCKKCGSTRVTGIVEAYCVGPVQVAENGNLIVTDGRFEIHHEYDISSGSIQCENCGHGEARIEGRVPALASKD